MLLVNISSLCSDSVCSFLFQVMLAVTSWCRTRGAFMALGPTAGRGTQTWAPSTVWWTTRRSWLCWRHTYMIVIQWMEIDGWFPLCHMPGLVWATAGSGPMAATSSSCLWLCNQEMGTVWWWTNHHHRCFSSHAIIPTPSSATRVSLCSLLLQSLILQVWSACCFSADVQTPVLQRRVKVQLRAGSADLNDPAVQESILQQVRGHTTPCSCCRAAAEPHQTAASCIFKLKNQRIIWWHFPLVCMSSVSKKENSQWQQCCHEFTINKKQTEALTRGVGIRN